MLIAAFRIVFSSIQRLNVSLALVVISFGQIRLLSDFTNKIFRQVYSDSPDFFSTLPSTVICGSAL